MLLLIVLTRECDSPESLAQLRHQDPRLLGIRTAVFAVRFFDAFAEFDTLLQSLYLLEKHKSALLPASGPERVTALEWLMSCNATLHPAYAKVFFGLKNFEGETQQKVVTAAIQQVNKLWEEVETRLSAHPYLAGKDLTVADILLTVIANWSGYFADKGKVKIGEHTKKLLRNVVARPAYQKALATEHVEYKAAA